jgi:hypothetical protein
MLKAKMVTGTENLLMARVPNDKNEVSQQMLRALLAPLYVSRKNQLAVTEFVALSLTHAERINEFLGGCQCARPP